MKLTRNEIETLWNNWNTAWDNHDLNSVMEFFHDDIYFNNWTGGSAKGKEQLRNAWQDWFLNHGNFEFVQEENFIDVENQLFSVKVFFNRKRHLKHNDLV